MEYKNYIVPKEEKIEDLARQFGLSVAQLKELNPQMRTFTNIWGTETYISVQQVIKVPYKNNENPYEKGIDFDFTKNQKEKKQKLSEYEDILKNLHFDQKARYRCEQTVVMKIGEVVKSHSETKREFIVQRKKTPKILLYNIKLEDNIINFYPSYLKDSLELISEIDKIKCNVDIEVCPHTGRMKNILNLPQLYEEWKSFKISRFSNIENISEPKARQNARQFLNIIDQQFKVQKEFITDLETKLFFDLFFGKYLIGKDSFNSCDPISFNSQLFNGIKLNLDMNSHILRETPQIIEVRRVSELDKTTLPVTELIKRYDEHYRPVLGYKFSEFDFSYRTRNTYNKEETLIENANVTIIEKIKNNVQIMIDYKLKRVEL